MNEASFFGLYLYLISRFFIFTIRNFKQAQSPHFRLKLKYENQPISKQNI